ncbi:MAG TPA: 2-dehydropantoate 2-reductase [Stellaceae bacterium]|nr:2-dehydropantoate 2-reductase [Stellaceae bacterium]
MRILVVGAGAIGGYFGGRMLAAGRDVTFLVRPRRAAQLAATGLVIKSAKGDVSLAAPPVILADQLRQPFDLVLVSCKAYDLEDAIASFAPAVAPRTAILPLLNGIRHLDTLEARFGSEAVLGGQCIIAATLDPAGTILHLNTDHQLTFGERGGAKSDRIRAIAAEMANAVFEHRTSDRILLEMWEKWVFLAALAGGTCLMRASIGEIMRAPRGKEIMLNLLEECRMTAAANRFEPRDDFMARCRGLLTAPDSSFTASMLRDMERQAPIEADHILGDLIRRRNEAEATQGGIALLDLAYAHLKAYEARLLALKA